MRLDRAAAVALQCGVAAVVDAAVARLLQASHDVVGAGGDVPSRDGESAARSASSALSREVEVAAMAWRDVAASTVAVWLVGVPYAGTSVGGSREMYDTMARGVRVSWSGGVPWTRARVAVLPSCPLRR